MSNKEKRLLVILLYLLVIAGFYLGYRINVVQRDIRAINSRMPFEPYVEARFGGNENRIEILEEDSEKFSSWISGTAQTFNNRSYDLHLVEDKILDIQGVLERLDAIESFIDFPYVDQLGADAEFKNDCGSAAILMVAEFYGVAEDETVDEIHQDMMGGDYPSTYIVVTDYLESRYGLETKLVTNYDWVIIALENNGFDVSEIGLVSDDDIEYLQNRGPMIWVYATENHWVVRYFGWNFDPRNGVFRFGETEMKRLINQPELGLGIVVVQ